MAFELSKSQKSIQKVAREFAKGEFEKEIALDLDKNGRFPDRIWQAAAELGFTGIHLPEKFGGGGMGMMEQVLVAETFSRQDPTLGAAVILSATGVTCLAEFAAETRKKRFLPEILEGRRCAGATNACTTDGRQSAVTAKKTEDGWIVSGRVDNILNGSANGIHLVIVGSGQESESGGLAIIEAGLDGVFIEESSSAFGLRMTPRPHLILKEVRIPPENMVGTTGKGKGPTTLLKAEVRLLLSALALGTAQGAFDRALIHVRQRKQFGRSIGQFQVLRHNLVEMENRIQAARYFTYQSAATFKPRKPDAKGIAQAALVSSDAAVAVSSEAIQLLGGYGYTTEYEVERCYRDAKTIGLLCGHRSDMKDEIASALVEKRTYP